MIGELKLCYSARDQIMVTGVDLGHRSGRPDFLPESRGCLMVSAKPQGAGYSTNTAYGVQTGATGGALLAHLGL